MSLIIVIYCQSCGVKSAISKYIGSLGDNLVSQIRINTVEITAQKVEGRIQVLSCTNKMPDEWKIVGIRTGLKVTHFRYDINQVSTIDIPEIIYIFLEPHFSFLVLIALSINSLYLYVLHSSCSALH